jgi:hypothetical protein
MLYHWLANVEASELFVGMVAGIWDAAASWFASQIKQEYYAIRLHILLSTNWPGNADLFDIRTLIGAIQNELLRAISQGLPC